ncbi:MAG: hypothetical protein QOF59_243 [Actinomycetota bacterium]|jgi:hypothetical protein|nr:hypothetical protein [Actinomycetota bacterium]
MNPVTRNEAVWSIDDLELELRKLPGVRAAGFDDVDDLLMVQLHVADTGDRVPQNERADQPVPVSASRIAARHSDRPVAVEVVRWRSFASIPQPIAAPAEVSAPAQPRGVATSGAAEAAVEAPESAATESAAPRSEAPRSEAPRSETPQPETSDSSSSASRARLLAVLAFPDTDELEVHLVHGGKRTIGRAPASAGIEGAVNATIAAVRDLGARINPRLEWSRAVDDASSGDEVVVAVALGGVEGRSPVHYGLASGISLIDAAARATLDALNRQLSRLS